jgi:hypothetical protein
MTDTPRFVLGFAAIAEQIPEIVGEPLRNEKWDGNGNQIQGTTTGLLVWRKADNWTAFTDGYWTWVNGPNGIERRLNTERFPWENDQPAYTPALLLMPLNRLSARYPYLTVPKGFAIHGTRSGYSRPVQSEFPGAAGYEVNRIDGCGAVCTLGEDTVAQHLPWNQWPWHARRASRYYVACEYAQGTADDEITDGEVRSFAWVVQQVRAVYPTIPLLFRTHAELENEGETGPNPETGRNDGKSDVFGYQDPRADELRARTYARLAELGITE